MNRIDLNGRTAIITGGASGLGYAAAQRFLQSGAAVWIWDADPEQLGLARRSLSDFGDISAIQVDVSRFDNVQRALDTMSAKADRIDVLVNSAGIDQTPMPMTEMALAEWDRVIAVNLSGLFYCCKALVPGMVSRGYGRIVNVSSIAGKEGNANLAAYSASKAGIIGLTKSLGKELASSGVIVNCIAPSVFDTKMHRKTRDADPDLMQAILARIPMQRPGHAEEFAALAAWMSSEECSFTTGFVFDLSGGRATY